MESERFRCSTNILLKFLNRKKKYLKQKKSILRKRDGIFYLQFNLWVPKKSSKVEWPISNFKIFWLSNRYGKFNLTVKINTKFNDS